MTMQIKMTGQERDILMKMSIRELQVRLLLIDYTIKLAVQQAVGEDKLKEFIRQKEMIIKVIKDKKKTTPKAPKRSGVVIQLKPLLLTARSGVGR